LNIQAYTAMGSQMILSQIDQTSWDMNNFPSGVYIIEIFTDTGIVRKKIIKN